MRTKDKCIFLGIIITIFVFAGTYCHFNYPTSMFPFSFFFIVGVYILSRSPFILELDREKNICTKKSKHIWQKRYKVKTVCKLSEVLSAEATTYLVCDTLYLKLKSGKSITVFITFPQPRGYITSDLLGDAEQINTFIKGTNKHCSVKYSSDFIGFAWLSYPLIMVIIGALAHLL